MALADLFSNSLITPVLNWAKTQGIPEAAGSLLAAYAIPALAGGLIRKQHRGQVQGMLAQPFIANAFQALQRPQQARDFMTKYQIQEQGLTPTAPYPGAQPVQDFNGIPLYTPQTIAQKYPDQFGPRSPYPSALTSPQFTPPASAIEPSSLRPIPDVKPLLPSMQMIGGMPANRASLPTILALMQKQEEEQALQNRFQLGDTAMDAAVAKNQDLVKVPKMGAKGYMTSELQQRKAGARPLVRDFDVTTADGRVMKVPHQSDDNGKTWMPIEGMGGPKFNPKGAEARPLVRDFDVTNADGNVMRVPHQSTDNGKTWTPIAGMGGPKFNPNRGTLLQDLSNTMDLKDINKEAAGIQKQLTPFRDLLNQYPKGDIPQTEVLRRMIFEGPLANMKDSAPLQAAIARLAELEQQKQQILGGQGGQPAPATAPSTNIVDFNKSLE